MINKIILFDGVCNLCNATVNFIIRNDPEQLFKFAPLQSAFGQEILKNSGLSILKLETVILIENKELFIKSTAALKIAKDLKGFWKVFYVLMIIPKPVRDFFYDLVAKNRYTLFGRKKSCMIPDKETIMRFISS